MSETAYMPCAECLDEATRGVRFAMKEVRDSTAKILERTTLASVNAGVAGLKRRPNTRRKTS